MLPSPRALTSACLTLTLAAVVAVASDPPVVDANSHAVSASSGSGSGSGDSGDSQSGGSGNTGRGSSGSDDSGSGHSGSGNSGSNDSGSGSDDSGSNDSGSNDSGSRDSKPTGRGDDPGDDNRESSGRGKPELGKSAGTSQTAGTVLVKEPGKSRFSRVARGDVVPMGSVMDTRQGTVAITTALPSGGHQTGSFGGGLFKVVQGRDGYVDLYLRGRYCSRPTSRASLMSAVFSSASNKRGRSSRRLFGRDHGGRYRTHGRHSHATVRGTRWSVEDRCDGTLTKVTQGAVAVRDFTRRRTVLVKAGERYLARARR